MKSFVLKAMVLSFLFLGSLAAGARAQLNDHEGCSNAVLKGDYAFTVSGTIWVKDPQGNLEAIQREGIAMTRFDGQGGLSQVDYVLSGLNALPAPPPAPTDPLTGFHIMETGTYQVYSDCTGTFTINSPGTTIAVKFVLSNHGKGIHTIVTSLVGPNGPITALIHSEGHRLGKLPKEWD